MYLKKLRLVKKTLKTCEMYLVWKKQQQAMISLHRMADERFWSDFIFHYSQPQRYKRNKNYSIIIRANLSTSKSYWHHRGIGMLPSQKDFSFTILAKDLTTRSFWLDICWQYLKKYKSIMYNFYLHKLTSFCVIKNVLLLLNPVFRFDWTSQLNNQINIEIGITQPNLQPTEKYLDLEIEAQFQNL